MSNRHTVRVLSPAERAIMEPALQRARQLQAEADATAIRARDARAFLSSMVALLNGGDPDSSVSLDEDRWELYRVAEP